MMLRLTPRLRASHTGDYVQSYSAASVARNQYIRARTVVGASLGWEARPGVGLSCDVATATKAHQVYYRGVPDQMSLDRNSGTAVTFSVNGRF